MRDAMENLAKVIERVLNPHSPQLTFSENEKLVEEESENDNQGENMKFIIPSNIIHMWIRIDVLLELKLSGYTDTLTKARNVIDDLHKRCEVPNAKRYRNALGNFYRQKVDLPCKLLEQIACNSRPEIEEQHMLIGMNKILYEKHLAQALRTINKEFKLAIAHATGYNGILYITIQIIILMLQNRILIVTSTSK